MVMASHCVGLTLPGMIEEPGSFSGMISSPKSAARSGSQPADVVRDLHERGRQRFQRSLGKDDLVVRRQRGELVGMRHERQAGEFGNFLGGALGEFRMRVQSGAHRSAADGEIVKPWQTCFSRSMSRSSRLAQPENSCPTVSGMASCRCVRPILTTSLNSLLWHRLHHALL